MEGITIDEICAKLKLPFKTVEGRIQRAKIKPLTRQALYPKDTLKKIENTVMGRPKKENDKQKKQKSK
jgi:hypothetical protein